MPWTWDHLDALAKLPVKPRRPRLSGRSRVRRLLAALVAAVVALGTGTPSASAAIGADHWQYGTIYVQNVTPAHAWSAKVQNRVLYYHNLGAHWNVIWGTCQAGYPCIRLAIAAYGNTGWTGLTVWPPTCADADTWCNFAGNINDSSHMAKLFINTSGSEQSDAEILANACHELGHALANLQHAPDTSSCMYGSDLPLAVSWLTEAEKQQVRDRFASIWFGP